MKTAMASSTSILSDPTGPETHSELLEAPARLSPSFGEGLVRPTCHWLTERMSEAQLSPVDDAASDESTSGSTCETATDSDAERIAAIETLVALAAKIEAARAGGETYVAPETEAPAAVEELRADADMVPQFIGDQLEVAGIPTVSHAAEMPVAYEEQAPADQHDENAPAEAIERPTPGDIDYALRLREALRAHYPESALLLVAIALVGVWAYASTPRTRDHVPVPAIAEIRPDEAVPASASPAPENARLKFVGKQSCAGGACETLLTLAPAPAAPDAPGGSSASYTAAAQPEAATESTQASEPTSPATESEAPAQAPPPAVASTSAGPAPETERVGTEPVASPSTAPEEPAAAPAQDAAPVVATTAADTAPEAEQINTQPVATEPIKTEPLAPEPALAALEQPPATIEPPADDVSVATPSALEASPGSATEAPSESAAIVPEASPVETLDVEMQAKSKDAATQPPASTAAAIARPAKVLPANRKSLPPQTAKKNAVAALPKTAPAKTASTKTALPKTTLPKTALKAAPAEKQAATSGKPANKAPGFPAASPSALFKPAPPPAAASNAPEPAPEAGFAAGDKPPGFEIQTNLGGGFFAMQPY